MSTNNRVFEETLVIKYIDKDLKVFDKVQRCEGKTKDTDYYISMDINSEIYPMKRDNSYTILLVRSIYESKPTPKYFDYVMCGKVFQFSKDKVKNPVPEDSEPTLSIGISFGGLLFQISGLKRDEKTGKPKGFEDINLDDTLYLLIKNLKNN